MSHLHSCWDAGAVCKHPLSKTRGKQGSKEMKSQKSKGFDHSGLKETSKPPRSDEMAQKVEEIDDWPKLYLKPT